MSLLSDVHFSRAWVLFSLPLVTGRLVQLFRLKPKAVAMEMAEENWVTFKAFSREYKAVL